MPELPEVETVVNILKKLVINKKINKIKILLNKLVKYPISINEFKKNLENKVILNIERIGKNIIFVFDKYVLISHLRMEGKYYYVTNNNFTNIDEKHILLSFLFADGSSLHYHDTRRFGTMHLFLKNKYKKINPISKIGPEPWSKKCNLIYLQNKLSKKRIAIKSALLDQTIMAGLGNIYVNEVLFACQINPQKAAFSLTTNEIKLILKYSQKIMKKAIKLGGSSISSYTSSLGVSGKFQNELQVHTKNGQKCLRCKSIIKKIKVNGRGTYFCPECQKN